MNRRLHSILGYTAVPILLLAAWAQPAFAESKDIDWGKVAMMFANFFIYAGILGYFAVPALSKYFKKRHLTIQEALDESAKLRDEAKAKLDEYSTRIAGVEKEIDALLAETRKTAEAERERIIADAKTQAANMERDAELRIQAEIQRARAMLEREVVVAATEVAEKLLKVRTTGSDHNQLVDTFIGSLDKPAATQETR